MHTSSAKFCARVGINVRCLMSLRQPRDGELHILQQLEQLCPATQSNRRVATRVHFQWTARIQCRRRRLATVQQTFCLVHRCRACTADHKRGRSTASNRRPPACARRPNPPPYHPSEPPQLRCAQPRSRAGPRRARAASPPIPAPRAAARPAPWPCPRWMPRRALR